MSMKAPAMIIIGNMDMVDSFIVIGFRKRKHTAEKSVQKFVETPFRRESCLASFMEKAQTEKNVLFDN